MVKLSCILTLHVSTTFKSSPYLLLKIDTTLISQIISYILKIGFWIYPLINVWLLAWPVSFHYWAPCFTKVCDQQRAYYALISKFLWNCYNYRIFISSSYWNYPSKFFFHRYALQTFCCLSPSSSWFFSIPISFSSCYGQAKNWIPSKQYHLVLLKIQLIAKWDARC